MAMTKSPIKTAESNTEIKTHPEASHNLSRKEPQNLKIMYAKVAKSIFNSFPYARLSYTRTTLKKCLALTDQASQGTL